MEPKKQKTQSKQTVAQDKEGKQLTFYTNETIFNQYQVCRPYPNQTKCITLVSSVVIKILYLFFVAFTYLLLAQTSIAQRIDSVAQMQNQIQKYMEVIFILSLGIKAIIFVGIFLDHKYYQEKGVDILLMRFIEFLRSHLRILIEFDLQSSALSLTTESSLMLANFTVSLAIISFALIFLQNYSIRRDLFYIGSINFYFLSRFNVMFGSMANYFCLIMNDSSISLYCFLFLHSVLAFAQTVSFISEGSTLYRAPFLRWGNFFSVIIYAALIVNMWMFFSINLDLFKFCVYPSLTVLVFFIQFYIKIQNERLKIATEEGNLPLKTFYLLQMLEESNENIETRTFIDGLLIMHINQECNNPQCYTNNQVLYDGKAKLIVSTQQLHRNRASLLKFYIKCKFQTFLQQDQKDLDLMLSYAQFIYFQFSNVGLCMYWLKRLNQNRDRLGLTTKLKLNSLLRLIREDNIVFYGKNFEIEDLIEAEQTNKSIIHQTLQIIQQKVNLWKLLQNQEINLSVLRARTEQIMTKIHQNNQQWKTISNHLRKSKEWKYQYLFYALFFKNQLIKSKALEQVNQFELKDKHISTEQDLRKMDMFDEHSCTLHTFIHNGEIFIKQVSKHFINITGYSKGQVQYFNLDVLMPKFIAKKHQNLMIKMSLDGQLSADSVKINKQVYIVHKDGYILPVVKIYKEFVSKTGELEYICFLKKVEEDQCVLLCDPHLEIQAISKKMMDKVTGQRDGEYMKKMNLISFMPQLANISCFKQFSVTTNTELVSSVKMISKEDQRKQIYGQTQSVVYIQDKSHSQPLNFKSSNILDFVYPSQPLANFSQSYQHSLRNIKRADLSSYTQLIHKFNKKMTKDRYRIFNCSLQIYEVQNSDGIRFYEVKLNNLHSNHPKQERKVPQLREQPMLSLSLPARQPIRQARQNIKTSDNIFIKQQSNKPKQTNIHISHIKGLLIFLFIMLFGSELLNKLLLQDQLSNISNTINTLNSTVQISIIYNLLVGHYFEQFISNAHDTADIMELTTQIQLAINQPNFRRIIYESSINPDHTYDFPKNNNESPDEIDLIFLIQSSLQTLSNPQNLQINSSSYQQLMKLQYPSFYQFLETIKQNIFLSCYSKIKIIKSSQVVIFTVQMVIVAIIMLCALIKCYKFYGSMQEMMKIHCHFGEKDLHRVRKYYKHVISIFRQFQSIQTVKSKITGCEPIVLQKQLNNYSKDPNLNKRSKSLVNGQHFESYKLKNFIKFIAIFCLLFLIIVGRNISVSMLTNPTDQKIDDINIFFKHIPTHYAAAQVVAHSYLPSTVPTFNATLYQPLLTNLRDLINEPFIGSPKADSFSKRIKVFYYANACQSGKNSLQRQNISLIDCETVANNSLKNGLREYSRYQEKQLHLILYQGRKASLQDFYEFFESIQIYHAINIDLVNQAISQYIFFIDGGLAQINELALLAACLLTAIALIIKIHLLDFLREEYAFYMFFYENMMPQFIIASEKLVRSNLVVINFL